MTTRVDLDRRLHQLESEVVSLGGMVEKAVRRAVEEGELSEDLADMILEADIVLDGFDGGGAGG